MLNLLNKLLFIIGLLLSVNAMAQSGWTRSKGSFFGKLDFSHLSANTFYTPQGVALETSTFRQSSLNWFGEYGISDRWTLITSMPLLRSNSFETTESVYGMGDLKLEFKYRLFSDSNWPVAVSIAPEIPIGRRNAFASSKDNPQDRINLPTGDGEFNIWGTIAASKSIGKAYFSAYGAYNFRTQYEGLSFRDLYQFGVEFGVNPIHNLWLNTKLRAQFSTGESQYPELGFVRGDGTTYTLYSIEAFYKFSKNIGMAATFLSGSDFISPYRNIYIAPFFSLGIIYEKQ